MYGFDDDFTAILVYITVYTFIRIFTVQLTTHCGPLVYSIGISRLLLIIAIFVECLNILYNFDTLQSFA